MRIRLAYLFFTLICANVIVSAQEPDNSRMKRARTRDDYRARTLKDIFALKPDIDDLRDKQGRLVVTKDILPSRVDVVYAESQRSLPQLKKESIRQWARLYAGSMDHYTEPYQSEMAFIENGVRYWLAVPKNSKLLKDTFKTGEPLRLYLIRLGAAIIGENYDWTLLVEDFQQGGESKPSAELQFEEMSFGKPPLVNLVFDVVLRNPESKSRWFVLPSNLGGNHSTTIGEKGGVDTLEVFAPRGNGHVIIGRFLGTGGFSALLLAPHSEVRLRRFPISYWGDPPESLDLDIVIANSVRIGPNSIDSWFQDNAMSGTSADISEDAESTKRIIHSKHTTDNKEVPATLDADKTLHLTVTLRKTR